MRFEPYYGGVAAVDRVQSQTARCGYTCKPKQSQYRRVLEVSRMPL